MKIIKFEVRLKGKPIHTLALAENDLNLVGFCLDDSIRKELDKGGILVNRLNQQVHFNTRITEDTIIHILSPGYKFFEPTPQKLIIEGCFNRMRRYNWRRSKYWPDFIYINDTGYYAKNHLFACQFNIKNAAAKPLIDVPDKARIKISCRVNPFHNKLGGDLTRITLLEVL
jgi:hypothetical protein